MDLQTVTIDENGKDCWIEKESLRKQQETYIKHNKLENISPFTGLDL